MDWVICLLFKDVQEMFAQWQEKQLPVRSVQSFFGLEATVNLLMLILFALLLSFSFHRQQHSLSRLLGFRQKLGKKKKILYLLRFTPLISLCNRATFKSQPSLNWLTAHHSHQWSKLGALLFVFKVSHVGKTSIYVTSLCQWRVATFAWMRRDSFSKGIWPGAGTFARCGEGFVSSNRSKSFQDEGRVSAESRRADRCRQFSVTQLAPLMKTIALQGAVSSNPLRLFGD